MQISQKKAGALLSYLSEAVKILTTLVYTPIMLRLLGQSEYGLYQLVSSVVSYLGLLSLGFGSSYVRFYSRCKAAKDEDEEARLNGMFMLIFTAIAVVCVLCGFVLETNITTIFGSGLTEAEYATARVLMAIMVLNLAITFPNTVFNCIITAHEQFIFQKSLILMQYVFNPFLTLPLLIMGYGSVGMVLVTTFLTIVTTILNIYYCFVRLHVRFSFRNLKPALLKEMWIFTFFIFLNQIIDQINWSIDKFLLGRMAGTTAVAVYGIGGQINTLYVQFSSSISNVFGPHVNRIVAERDDDWELTKVLTRVGRVQFYVLALILSGFIFFGHPFVLHWAGKDYSDSYGVALLLIAPVTIPLIQNLGIEIQRARNKHQARSIVYFFIAIGNIFLSIPLIRIMGPKGAALGTAISLLIGNGLFMNFYYQRYLHLKMGYYWMNIGKILPGLIAPVVAGILMNRFLDLNRIPVLAVCILIYTLIYAASMWFLVMNDYEKNLVAGRLIKKRNERKESK